MRVRIRNKNVKSGSLPLPPILVFRPSSLRFSSFICWRKKEKKIKESHITRNLSHSPNYPTDRGFSPGNISLRNTIHLKSINAITAALTTPRTRVWWPFNKGRGSLRQKPASVMTLKQRNGGKRNCCWLDLSSRWRDAPRSRSYMIWVRLLLNQREKKKKKTYKEYCVCIRWHFGEGIEGNGTSNP